ncbi:MAG: tetratricopeptide (TPR) repeat protein [Phycisphaerales bacterium]|jgi:tetratricopeptide (TPR) repeat protein
MRRMTRLNQQSRRSPALLAALAGLPLIVGLTPPAAAALSGSLTTSLCTAQPTTIDPADSFQKLAQLAADERSDPGEPFDLGLGVAPPDDLISPENTAAHEPLSTVRARLVAALPEPIELGAGADHEAVINATRKYVEARSRLANDDLQGAITLLEEAAALDQDSPAIMAELGSARIRAGRIQTATAVLNQAVLLGDRTPDTLYTLARLRLDRGETELALPLLAAAWDAIKPGSDPALKPLITAQLGVGLIESGSILAGGEALAESLRSPARLNATTNFLPDFGAWVRNRKALLDRAARAFWNVGEVTRAAELYAMADDSGSFNPDDLLTRLVAAHAAAGHPAAAALTVLDSLSPLTRPVTDRQARLLRVLRDQTKLDSLLLDAIDSLATQAEQSPPSIRSGLVLARAACQTDRETLRTMRAASAKPWASSDVIRRWIKAEPNARSIVSESLKIVSAVPGQAEPIASALFLSPADTAGVFEMLSGRDSLAARLLTARLALAVSRPDLVAGSLNNPASLIECHVSAAEGMAAGARGDWPAYENALAGLSDAEACPPALLGEFLAAGQRYDAAIRAVSDFPSDKNAQLVHASVARTLGRLDEAAEALERAVALDPTDEGPHQQLLEVLTLGPQDEAKLGPVLRRLRAALPSGRLLRQLMTQNMVQSRMLPQAERSLNEMLDDGAPVEEIVPLLTAVWRAQIENNATPETLAAPIDRLGEFHARYPASLDIANALGGLLVAAGENDEALAVLGRTSESRLESPDTARVIEQLMRAALGQNDAANAHARARLDHPTLGIDESLELAELLTVSDVAALARVAPLVVGSIPQPAQLTPPQRTAVASLFDRVANSTAAAQGDADVIAAALTLADLALSRGIKLGPSQHERRLRLMAPVAPLDRVLAACRDAIGQYPQLGHSVWILSAQTLSRAQRADDAVAVITEGVVELGEPLSPEVLTTLIQAAAASGSVDVVRAMISRIDDEGLTRPIAESLATLFPLPGGSVFATAKPERFRAELAYLFAGATGREPQSGDLLELAIEYDATHPWAANDLGYSLAESGRDLPRAERLLMTAVEALPESGSVIDSLGWLRYKLGLIEDDGETEGAITLLTRASEQTDGAANATIFLHLGDALWRVGRAEEARGAWAQALMLVSREQVQPRANAQLPAQVTREIKAARDRLEASRENTGDPPIAPLASETPAEPDP